MLKLSRVSKSYEGVPVLREIDLSIPKGQVTVIIGASGCGKSTLIRLANGLVLPDQGTVELMGMPVTDSTALALRRRMGYVIQEGGLFPHLTARGNVALMPRRLGWPFARIDSRVSELAGLVRLPVIGRSVELTAAELRSPETLREAALKKIRQAAAKAERSRLTEAKLVLFDDGHGVIEPAYHLIVERWIRLQEDQSTMIPLDFYVPVLSKPQAQYPDMEVAQLKPDDGLNEEPVATDVDD